MIVSIPSYDPDTKNIEMIEVELNPDEAKEESQ